MPRQPSLPETKLAQSADVSMQLGGIGSTQNMQLSQVQCTVDYAHKNFKQN